LVPSSELIDKSIYIYLLPWTVDNGPEEKWTVRHTFSYDSLKAIIAANPRIVHLATVQSRERATIEDAVVLDTRVRGGGLKKSINSRRIEQVQPLSQHNWDIGAWDGIGYQSNGVVVVRLPKRILEGDPNFRLSAMTDNQVREMVTKYLAYGVFPIIEYY
jgi:hypothetical protein